jgi:predicted dehydrogenase
MDSITSSISVMNQSRREFLRVSAGITAGTLLSSRAANGKVYRAAVIGRTGGGNYGHGFDSIFKGERNVTLEAIADADLKGLEAAAKRSGAKRQYASFQEMLRKEKPELVAVAPRQPDCHKAMALAALEVGAHLIVEKPFTEFLDEADAIVKAAREKNLKILVGHKNRYSADFARMKRLIQEGFLGTVLEMRVQGKQDGRAGGEDLMVLGTHDFDTMRWFFGDPSWCFASVTANGEPVTKADVRRGREPMLVAGDTVRAMFQFPNNILCTWQSVTAEKEWNTLPAGKERWGFTIFGTKRILAYYSGSTPLCLDTPFLGHKSESAEWKPLPSPKNWPPVPRELNLVQNLIDAVENDQQPLCNAEDGRWTIEMVSAIYESHRNRRPVDFPLKERSGLFLRS